jgi:hypothetical protein
MNPGKIVLALGAALVGSTVGIASAKLPALTDDQKAKAAETKAKADEAAKKDADNKARRLPGFCLRLYDNNELP